MDTNFIIAQVFGVLTIICSVCSMQFKKRKHIFIVLLLLNLFAALNLVFLNSLGSAYITFFAIVEMIINALFERNKKPVPIFVIALYIVINIALGLLSFNGPLDIIPIVCAILYCFVILAKREQNIRKLTLVNQCCWLVYDISIGAYSLSVSNILTIISIIIALVRFKDKGTKKNNKPKKGKHDKRPQPHTKR